MSQFDALFAESGKPALMDQLARTVVYRDPDADDLTISAIVEAAITELDEDDSNRRYRRTRRVKVSLLATDGIVDPGPQGSFLIDGEVWRVEAVDRTGSIATIRCVAGGVLERSAPNYREG